MSKQANRDKKQGRDWRRIRIRKRLSGTADRPRICLFKSTRYLYAQAVDDLAHRTLAAASSLEAAVRSELKTSAKHLKVAQRVGELLSERLKAKGIEQAVFDRGGYIYHGRVKALAEGARKGGIRF